MIKKGFVFLDNVCRGRRRWRTAYQGQGDLQKASDSGACEELSEELQERDEQVYSHDVFLVALF